jgi:hypothetical protein
MLKLFHQELSEPKSARAADVMPVAARKEQATVATILRIS